MLDVIKTTLKEKGSFRIVFFGDSITSAEWVHPNWREIVEYVLKEELQKEFEDWKVPSWGIRCINSGLDGSTTVDWLNRVQSDVIFYEPDLVICMGTNNDRYFEITPDQQKQNISELTSILTKRVPHVFYCTGIPSNDSEHSSTYAPFYQSTKSLFPHEKVEFIDMQEEFKLFELNRFYTLISVGNEVVGIKAGEIDYLHPNQLGNAYIAKIMLEKGFGVSFDPEKYIRTTSESYMFPHY